MINRRTFLKVLSSIGLLPLLSRLPALRNLDTNDPFQLTLDTSGGDMLVSFRGLVESHAGQVAHLGLRIDGVWRGDSEGITGVVGDGTYPASLVYIAQNIPAGRHTVELVHWGGQLIETDTLLTQFWCRELGTSAEYRTILAN